MERILSRTIQSLQGDKPAVWATVIAQSGSAPRAAGSRMLMLEGPEILGSVGGGLVEGRALEAGLPLLDRPGQKLLSLSLSGREVADSDMICGGEMEVFIETIPPNALPFLRVFKEALSRPGMLVFLTLISEKQIPFDERHVLWSEGEAIAGGLPLSGDIGTALSGVAQGEKPALLSVPGHDEYLFAEPVERPSILHIFGGGHISLDLAWIAHRVGFEVIIIDDREDFANRERFPMATEVRTLPFEEAVREVELGQRDYVVIVTRGHLHDLVVLRQAIEQSPAYIGMIGSRRKKAMIFDQLRKEGVSQEQLDRVYAPIGLKIKAETPAEIAVSIVAELIEVRARERIGDGLGQWSKKT
jgi:xanthine dehydrogenase accessory factor